MPRSGDRPRLTSIVALCSEAYRLSKRQVASFCEEVLGVSLVIGVISMSGSSDSP